MSFPSTQFEMPERFNAEEINERSWHVWRTSANGDGGIELVYGTFYGALFETLISCPRNRGHYTSKTTVHFAAPAHIM